MFVSVVGNLDNNHLSIPLGFHEENEGTINFTGNGGSVVIGTNSSAPMLISLSVPTAMFMSGLTAVWETSTFTLRQILTSP